MSVNGPRRGALLHEQDFDARTSHIGRTILIDCGKTFRESVFKWFPQQNITRIDALILTRGFFKRPNWES